MEIKIKFPNGGMLECKKEPMDQSRFWAIFWLAVLFISGSGFLKFFEMML